MRALAITRTMCCSGGETDPVCLCFTAWRAGEAWKSRFQPKRLHNRREETSLLAKADQLFFSRIAPVYQLGEKGGGREGISWCSEEGSWKQDPESSCLSALLTAARPPHPTSPGSYLRPLPA